MSRQGLGTKDRTARQIRNPDCSSCIVLINMTRLLQQPACFYPSLFRSILIKEDMFPPLRHTHNPPSHSSPPSKLQSHRLFNHSKGPKFLLKLQSSPCHTLEESSLLSCGRQKISNGGKQNEGKIVMRKKRRSSTRILNVIGNFGDLFDRVNTDELFEQFNLRAKKLSTKLRPPHRYKTCILIFRNCLLLYGGLGCEKGLTWAKLSFQTLEWSFPGPQVENTAIFTYIPQAPIYGHTMVKYRDIAIIFGGMSSDDMNELTILKHSNMQISQGARAPFRRREHAAVVFGDSMIVHGGLESRKTKSEVFIYSILQDKWTVASSSSSPALSNHRLAVAQIRGKGVPTSKQIFMFGGLNKKGACVNTLYRVKICSDNEVKFEPVECQNSPMPRHSFCLEPISSNHLLVYGGKGQNEETSSALSLSMGVFSDIHIFSINRRVWKRVDVEIEMDHIFGMGSASLNGCIFVFGGSSFDKYADASIKLLWAGGDNSEPWDSIRNSSEREIGSSKKGSANIIL